MGYRHRKLTITDVHAQVINEFFTFIADKYDLEQVLSDKLFDLRIINGLRSVLDQIFALIIRDIVGKLIIIGL